jgi:peptide/nickel transport system substrate-binding protein
MKKLIALILAALMGLTLLAGCDAEGGAPAAESEGTAKDSLVVAFISEPLMLDPSRAADTTSAMVCLNVYDPLVRRNSSGEIVPSLAESWKFAEDGMSVDFKIRQGVKFHNGYDLTAEDVVFTYNRTLGQPGSALFAEICKGLEKVDDTTVRMSLHYPEQAILQYMARANVIMSEKYFNEVGEDGYAAAPIGTGPYKLIEWQKGSKLTFERYDDYFMGPAPIKNVEMRILKELTTQMVALETGEVDLIHSLSGLDIANVKSNDKLSYYETAGTVIWSIGFNTQLEPFNNVKVRQALAMAINRDDILLGAADGSGVPLTIILPPQTTGNPGQENINTFEYDIEGAKALLAEAGYPDGFSTVISVRDDITKKIGSILQSEWKKLGVEAELNVLERAALITDQRAGLLECYFMGNVSMTTDASLLLSIMHSSTIPTLNNTFYRSDEYDALYTEQTLERDPEKRKEIITEMLNLAAEEVPMVPVYGPVTNLACNKDLVPDVDPSLDGVFWYNFSWK